MDGLVIAAGLIGIGWILWMWLYAAAVYFKLFMEKLVTIFYTPTPLSSAEIARRNQKHDWIDDLAMWMASGKTSQAAPPASGTNTDAGCYRLSGSALSPENKVSGSDRSSRRVDRPLLRRRRRYAARALVSLAANHRSRHHANIARSARPRIVFIASGVSHALASEAADRGRDHIMFDRPGYAAAL